MHRLHQLRVLNRRLSVEFADFTFLPEPRQTEQPSRKKQVPPLIYDNVRPGLCREKLVEIP